MAEAMKALKAFAYNRVKLKEGDIFKCKDRDVALVVAAKLATKPEVKIAAPTPVKPPVMTYQTRHMEAGPVKATDEVDRAAHDGMTVYELRAALIEKGVHLPSGYMTKSELMNILSGLE